MPKRPHPNCKCYVEIVEYEDVNSVPEPNEEGEQCDVLEQVDELITEIESAKYEVNSYIEDLQEGVIIQIVNAMNL